MNIISKMPTWAKNTTTALRNGQAIDGQKKVAYDENTGQGVGQALFASAVLASQDENAETDQALGQPGLVVQDDVQLQFEGDPQAASGTFESVLKGKAEEGDFAVFVHKDDTQIQTVSVARREGVLHYESAQLKPNAQGELEGYIISGEVPQ